MQNPQFVAATQMLVQACAPCQAPWIGRAAAHTARSHRGEAKPVLPGRSWSLTRKSGRIVRPALPKNVAARTRALLLQGICRTFRLPFSDDGRLNERPAERARLDGLQQTEVQPPPSGMSRDRDPGVVRPPASVRDCQQTAAGIFFDANAQFIRKRRIRQADIEAHRLRAEWKHAARRAATLRIVH